MSVFRQISDLPEAERLDRLHGMALSADVTGKVQELLEDAIEEDDSDWSPAGQMIRGYEVISELGRGGMGRVYAARDLDLDRGVAIKFLPQHVLGDEASVRRFLTEAKASSMLNHPNIVTIHQFIREPDTLAIVMERIDGVTLRKRIADASLSVAELLSYLRQTAEALAAAHKHAIVHRDIKPENIMVRADGYLKVLDFGLAGLADGATTDDRFISTGLTSLGGTPQYMSPEQRRGDPLTPASDMYSFGLVMQEMLARTAGPAPPWIAKLTHSLLAERPQDRPSANDVLQRLDLAAKRYRSGRLAFLITAITLAFAGALVGWMWFRHGAVSEAEATTLAPRALTTYGGDEVGTSFSPDGRQFTFAWNGLSADNFDIYVRDVGPGPPRRLTTDPNLDRDPVWSPDGQTIAFCRVMPDRTGHIMTVPAAGGPEREVAIAHGVTWIYYGRMEWSRDSQWIIFADPVSGVGVESTSIRAASVVTGEVRTLVEAASGQTLIQPSLSPDGTTLSFVSDMNGVSRLGLLHMTPDVRPQGSPVLARMEGFESAIVNTPLWRRSSGQLMFLSTKGGARSHLWTTAISPDLQSRQQPRMLASLGYGISLPSYSAACQCLAYTAVPSDSDLFRLDVNNPSAVTRIALSSLAERAARFSPDGRKIAFETDLSGKPAIWIANADGSAATQLTDCAGAVCGSPAWSPDGTKIAFDGRMHGHPDIFVMEAKPGAPVQRVTSDPSTDILPFWASSGEIFFNSNRNGQMAVWKVQPATGKVELVLNRSAFNPMLSADGRYLYFSEDGRLWWVPLSPGGKPQAIGPLLDQRGFSTGRSAVAYVRPGNPARMMLWDQTTRRERLLRNFDGKNIGLLSMSQDGQQIIFDDVVQHGSDLMIVEHVP